MARISTAYHRNVNPNITDSHYQPSGSEPQIIFRSVLLGKKRKQTTRLES